ncbi:phospho-sugar mutase [Nocardioidaceae bacterium]|nr:phospho-sugar mutase [Nocardioidaceae bacterium]
MTSTPPDLLARAREWADQDPDPETRARVEQLVAAADGDADAHARLADLFEGELEFGTAGLRAVMGPGPAAMNRVTVSRATAGLAAWLHAEGATQSPDGPLRVVVGYDARHNSETFALDTCTVMAGAGVEPLLLPRPLPTPVLAYAVRALGCAVGVMVTASHNPPADNGYKVFLADGAQLSPPHDAEVAAHIEAVGRVDELPRGDADRVRGVEEQLVDDYRAAVGRVVPEGARDLRIVYTPMHGVGRETALAVLAEAGFPEPYVVPEQGDPDPDFPTVDFPNPEEPGALDLALTLARRVGADIVIANDPDADRCALALPRDAIGGDWQVLTGDQIGALLGAHLARHGAPGTLACTLVSSSLLGRIAAAAGREHAETLTGFKWLARVEDLAFAYEEAIGFCVDPGNVRDKDGISALLLLAHLAADRKAGGGLLVDDLDDLARRHGVHATRQLSLRFEEGVGRAAAVLSGLREDPPTELAGLPVGAVEDLRDPASYGSDLPPTDGLRLRLGDTTRVVVRPSGTEPKLKCYLETVVAVDADADAESLAGSREEAEQLLTTLSDDLYARLETD